MKVLINLSVGPSGVSYVFLFQVVTGGHYDVDVTLKDPHGNILYDEKKKQYDSHTFTAKTPGKNPF